MAVPVCPDCGATIEPDWDWCQACGFDPEGIRPPDWSPSTGALAVFPARDTVSPSATASPGADSGSDRPPPALRPHDLLRPRPDAAASAAASLTGPLLAPEPETEHRPLTLDDLRSSTGAAARTDATASDAPARDRFAASGDRPRPASAPVAERPSGGGSARDDRPPLFPPTPSSAPVGVAGDATLEWSDLGTSSHEAGDLATVGDLDTDAAPTDSHPYFDLPYDSPSPAPGSEPEPEPTSRLRRRRADDDRPNAASMAMAAGRVPDAAPSGSPSASAPAGAPSGSTPLPPPPGAAAPARPIPTSSAQPASAPADTSSLGPIVFGAAASPTASIGKRPKAKSSPLSWAAIIMTIAIAVIVLWPTYQDLVGGETGPALPPPSAGAIGFAPAGPDGARPEIDPQRTASWSTSASAEGGFEVDMPGVVIIRDVPIPLESGQGEGTVASASSGRGGYVVAAIDPPASTPWTSLQQATDSIIKGFETTVGNELVAGAPTTLGGQPAVSVEGTVDGVPSSGAIVLVGNRAYLALAGNASAGDLQRFLASFKPTA